MLKLAVTGDEKTIDEFCRPFALGVRIRCLSKAYGLSSSLLSVWLGEENGEITAAVSLFDGAVTVLASDNADFSELSRFLCGLSFSSLCAQEEAVKKLGLSADYTKSMFVYTEPLKTAYEKADGEYENYSLVYQLISRSIPGSFSPEREAYLCWLSDFTYRRRRGLARLKTVADGENLLSCALTAAECADGAIISGVACDEKARGKHLGQRTVRTLCDELKKEGKRVFVIALNDSASSFYLKTGFTFYGKVSYIERKTH
ncbi:MAG: GNAT family N-acetyltransferase [Acutalibacteraceae bacterium]